MRIAALSDIHGNLWALDAVLADVARRNVDVIVNLGDIFSGALWPAQTADRLIPLAFPTIRGNHERQVLTTPRADMRLSDLHAADRLGAEHLQWMQQLPARLALTPEVLLVHGTPHSDLDYFLHSVDVAGLRSATAAEMAARAGAAGAAVILCGHTHLQAVAQLADGRLIVNPGSVGLQAYADDFPHAHVVEMGSPAARYAIVEQRRDGWSAQLLEVDYDWRTAAGVAASHGRGDWARALLTGRVQ
jgi:putative phosphoesterase